MKPEEITRLYDEGYAVAYDEKFLLSPPAKPENDHELELLRGFLTAGVRWLDVACGTGYFLRHFPQIERAGIDLSPAMLRLAREANPGVVLFERDFREPKASWADHWGLVSCMWYAYGLVDTVPLSGRLAERAGPACFGGQAQTDGVASYMLSTCFAGSRALGGSA
jgi:SAM-dependent methyltransferase